MSILSEIVKQMYVEPELLEMLSEENKQVLFRKIREEQVKQWIKKDKELEKKKKFFAKKRTPRKIDFKLGSDGQPWVWVMGEHSNDLSYEELVRLHEQEERERERLNELQDLKEAEELAKQETREIMSLAKMLGQVAVGSDEPDGGPVSGPASNPQTEARPLEVSMARSESQLDSSSASPAVKRDMKQEEEERKRTIARRTSLIGTTKEQRDDFQKKRAEELFNTMRRSKRIAKKRAAEMSKNVETWWKESKRRANDEERTRRDSFKKAREIVQKNPEVSDKIIEQISATRSKKLAARKGVKPAPAPPRQLSRLSSFVKPGTIPKTPAHIARWFKDNEAPKGVGREKDGSISVWFHGKLNRDGAEKLLEYKPAGSYIVRLCTRIWGYTVSVVSYSGCKHYTVDASRGQYHFMGPKQQKFNTLCDLLRFYRVNPVTWAGQEVLLLPVGQEEEDATAYQGLYNDDISELEESGTSL